MEDFLSLIFMLAAAGTVLGVVFGVVASFIRIGVLLAPIIVGISLAILFYQLNDYDIDFNDRADQIIDLLKNIDIPSLPETN
jgi:hypothetical protein